MKQDCWNVRLFMQVARSTGATMSEDMDEDFQGTDRPIRGFEQADGEDGFDDRDWVEKELHEAEEAAFAAVLAQIEHKPHFLPVIETCKMDGCRLEWSRCLDGGPGAWSLIGLSGAALATETAPGWYMPAFCVRGMNRLECRFTQWHPEAPHVAVFEAEELHFDNWINLPAGKVYVREVPSPLVITCSLMPVDQNTVDVVFTTVAGEEVLRIASVSSHSLEMELMEQLPTSATIAAAAQGRLQSRNQEVCTVLDGEPTPLDTLVLSDDLWDIVTAQDTQQP
ncbi:unnamed protein product [Symbiodinium natans]|uniref:Uncharacterized protein n=2 Tax=Symbiodinium natans TaxID=878477 RepID=A0A812S7F3_9DINO|nr:unnamed protein product [Symbiodinium natans]